MATHKVIQAMAVFFFFSFWKFQNLKHEKLQEKTFRFNIITKSYEAIMENDELFVKNLVKTYRKIEIISTITCYILKPKSCVRHCRMRHHD